MFFVNPEKRVRYNEQVFRAQADLIIDLSGRLAVLDAYLHNNERTTTHDKGHIKGNVVITVEHNSKGQTVPPKHRHLRAPI